MYSPKLYRTILLNLAVIVTAIAVAALLFGSGRGYVLGCLLLLTAVGLVFRLANLLNHFNQKVQHLIDTVLDNGLPLSIPSGGSKGEQNLQKAVERINLLVAEANLKSRWAELFYHAILENIPYGVIVWDKWYKVHTANVAALQFLGCDYLHTFWQVKHYCSELYQLGENRQQPNTRVIKVKVEGGERAITVSYRWISIADESYYILTFKEISSELSEKEVEAWTQLTHVLTHEIMNSVAPVVSLSETVLSYFEQDGCLVDTTSLSDATVGKAVRALKVMNMQGKHLASFTDSYRRLSHLPTPTFKRISARGLLERLEVLLEPEFLKHGIQLRVQLSPPELTLYADENLLFQVILNLVKNAMQAVEGVDHGMIRIAIVLQNDEVQISVADNGAGIDPSIIDDIFVPFFTTKECGSGIGLSLSKQIARMHGGQIQVSVQQHETLFRVTLPNNMP